MLSLTTSASYFSDDCASADLELRLACLIGPDSGATAVRIVIPAGLIVNVILGTQGCQKRKEFAGTFLYGKTHDLPARIDVCCQEQMPADGKLLLASGDGGCGS